MQDPAFEAGDLTKGLSPTNSRYPVRKKPVVSGSFRFVPNPLFHMEKKRLVLFLRFP